MSDVAIWPGGLNKRYGLGRQERYQTLWDTLADAETEPFRSLRLGAVLSILERNWPLKRVSFAIDHGGFSAGHLHQSLAVLGARN